MRSSYFGRTFRSPQYVVVATAVMLLSEDFQQGRDVGLGNLLRAILHKFVLSRRGKALADLVNIEACEVRLLKERLQAARGNAVLLLSFETIAGTDDEAEAVARRRARDRTAFSDTSSPRQPWTRATICASASAAGLAAPHSRSTQRDLLRRLPPVAAEPTRRPCPHERHPRQVNRHAPGRRRHHALIEVLLLHRHLPHADVVAALGLVVGVGGTTADVVAVEAR